MSRITMSVASFSAASAAIRFASCVVLLRRSSPLATRTSLARALPVQAFGGDDLGDPGGHEIGEILAAGDRIADRGGGEVDRLHLKRDHIGAGCGNAEPGRDDQRRLPADPISVPPAAKLGMIGADDQ